ncbi:MAG: SMC-Scp complex subunit ScpB [Defluviitaleaceae bacterium]|nr:SMC-Scp complex subunit ScpB [Defluviitaleaceae bacterium]
MNDLELLELERILEAILFACSDGLSLEKISLGLSVDHNTSKIIINSLKEKYKKENRGIQIDIVGELYQMVTNIKYKDNIKKILKSKETNLTKAQLETLAIIAYKQPVTKLTIEQIRGVDSTHPLNKLLEYELVEENGRLNAVGRPILFITTNEFLRQFGLDNLENLPNIEIENDSNSIINQT